MPVKQRRPSSSAWQTRVGVKMKTVSNRAIVFEILGGLAADEPRFIAMQRSTIHWLRFFWKA